MPIGADLRRGLGELARTHGDVALVEACAEVLAGFARSGARQQLAKRKGDPEIECPRCRERDAHRRQYEETMARTRTGRPIGGGGNASEET